MPLFVVTVSVAGACEIYIYIYMYMYICVKKWRSGSLPTLDGLRGRHSAQRLAKGPSIWSLLLLLLLFSWRRCSYGFLLRGWAIDSQDPFFAVKPDLVGNLFLKPFW